ncbi:MAG: aldo/keto reductase [Firmicutes bacterium]|nr:aldo/keto reductase [Bacillota bacterium]
MQYRKLGATGLNVSRLCFGALTIGPLQRNLSLAQGAGLIRLAIDMGINFIDTAESYHCYPYIREALKNCPARVNIASKSYAYTRDGMEKSLFDALSALERESIEIFLLHEQESYHTIKGHQAALDYLVSARARGLVRAVGISTHCVAGVRAAASVPEIEVIHPIINLQGIGIQDGSREEMLEAIAFAAAMGKGIYGMKCLGGGHLIPDADQAMEFVLSLPELAAVAVGMQSPEEILYNVARFAGQTPSPAIIPALAALPRRLHIEDWCRGCGQCVKRCSAGALRIKDERAVVDEARCRLCSYCAAVCSDFCIKII